MRGSPFGEGRCELIEFRPITGHFQFRRHHRSRGADLTVIPVLLYPLSSTDLKPCHLGGAPPSFSSQESTHNTAPVRWCVLARVPVKPPRCADLHLLSLMHKEVRDRPMQAPALPLGHPNSLCKQPCTYLPLRTPTGEVARRQLGDTSPPLPTPPAAEGPRYERVHRTPPRTRPNRGGEPPSRPGSIGHVTYATRLGEVQGLTVK